MGDKTKIDWADATWNPVTGCLHGCPYCYARGIANRFGGATYYSINKDGKIVEDKLIPPDEVTHVLDEPIMKDLLCPDGSTKSVKTAYPYHFEPTFHRYKLEEPQHWRKPRTIFVCSMADLFGSWVPDEWIKAVFDACRKAPQHRYLFLTKNPERLIDLSCEGKLPTDNNMWYGTTVTKSSDTGFFWWFRSPEHNTFLSIEPLLAPFPEEPGIRPILDRINWVIIGAETGNRKGKVVPEWSWVRSIEIACEDMSGWQRRCIPVFMKESLRGIMGDDFRQEFPWEV